MARLPAVQRDELSGEARKAFDEIFGPRGRMPPPFKLFLHSPEAARRIGSLTEYIGRHATPPRALRELAIITVSRELDCEYGYTHHRDVGLRNGLSEQAIDAVGHRRAPAGLSPDEAMVFRFAQEMVRKHRPSDEVFALAHKRFGTQGVMDLTLTVGFYMMMAHLIMALDVELDEKLTPVMPK